jgi:hypothetical protein
MNNKPKEYVNCRIKGEQKNICPYQRGRVVIAVRKQQSVELRSWWILIKHVGHEPVNLLLGYNCMKKKSYQLKIRLSLTNEEESGFTLSRFAAGIEQPWAFKCQLLLTVKGVNSPKMKLFDAVACPKSSLTEFGHALD